MVLAVGFGLLIFSLIGGLYTFHQVYQQEIEATRMLEKQLVATVRVQAEVATYAFNTMIAQGVLDGLAENPSIYATRIESTDHRFTIENLPAGWMGQFDFRKGTAYPLSSPFDPAASIGALTIVQNVDHIANMAWQVALRQTLLLMLQVLIAALIMTVVLRNLLVKPISQLSKDMANLRPGSPGRLTVGLPHAHDEIGQLSESANELLAATENAFHELNQANQSLAEAFGRLTEKEESKSRFFATASHDLRQPIHAITLFLDAMQQLEINEEQVKLVTSTQQASQALKDLLESLLDMSKLDAGAVVPRLEWVGVDEFFERLDNVISPLALQRHLRFKLWFPQRPMLIHTDRQLFNIVLANIVGNAVKNTVSGGVLVGLRRRHDGWAFQVWDTGVGISAEHINRIYEEFYQVNNPGRDRAKGLGLGLAIAQRISGLLGYQVHCRSQPGRGSVFEIVLPMSALHHGDTAAAETLPDVAVAVETIRGKRLVVLEDDRMVAQALGAWLHSCGCEVAIFASAEEAMDTDQVRRAEYFIVDDQLAGKLSGLEFLEHLQQQRNTRIKAVVVSGNTTREFMERAATAGWPILFKPTVPQQILARLMG